MLAQSFSTRADRLLPVRESSPGEDLDYERPMDGEQPRTERLRTLPLRSSLISSAEVTPDPRETSSSAIFRESLRLSSMSRSTAGRPVASETASTNRFAKREAKIGLGTFMDDNDDQRMLTSPNSPQQARSFHHSGARRATTKDSYSRTPSKEFDDGLTFGRQSPAVRASFGSKRGGNHDRCASGSGSSSTADVVSYDDEDDEEDAGDFPVQQAAVDRHQAIASSHDEEMDDILEAGVETSNMGPRMTEDASLRMSELRTPPVDKLTSLSGYLPLEPTPRPTHTPQPEQAAETSSTPPAWSSGNSAPAEALEVLRLKRELEALRQTVHTQREQADADRTQQQQQIRELESRLTFERQQVVKLQEVVAESLGKQDAMREALDLLNFEKDELQGQLIEERSKNTRAEADIRLFSRRNRTLHERYTALHQETEQLRLEIRRLQYETSPSSDGENYYKERLIKALAENEVLQQILENARLDANSTKHAGDMSPAAQLYYRSPSRQGRVQSESSHLLQRVRSVPLMNPEHSLDSAQYNDATPLGQSRSTKVSPVAARSSLQQNSSATVTSPWATQQSPSSRSYRSNDASSYDSGHPPSTPSKIERPQTPMDYLQLHKQLNEQLTSLIAEKQQVEAEMRKIPISGGGKFRRQKDALDSRLDELDSDIGRLKRQMREVGVF
ncbi:hypothetical protein BC832DRAFT_548177 [Gaertneriomyces semiglobifer]|nr:hypothetical protein BC832DRAFT_548177 [Gaertneriomyces semiglobifer]